MHARIRSTRASPRVARETMSARLAPWASVAEWRAVCDALAPVTTTSSSREDSEAVARALSTVRAWRARGRAPLAIEATAALLETMSRDRDARGGHLETMRAAYAMTLTRLVNGVVDPAQKGRYAAPVATLARKAGLARELVDLRHEATHDAMPGLGALRRGARRALAWCRRWYWDEQRRAFEEAMMGVRKRARELCACEADARALRERQGAGRGAETSDEEEEDARGGDGDGSSFKSIRERRRAAMGRLSSVCPKGAAHFMAECLFEDDDDAWLRVRDEEDEEDEGEGEEEEDDERVSAEDWRPTLARLCQKWPRLFETLFLRHATRAKPGDNAGFRVMLDLASSGELAAQARRACRVALERAREDVGVERWSDDPARAKRVVKTLQKIAGLTKDEIKTSNRVEPTRARDALASAKAEMESLRETLRSGRKRARESPWERAKNWSPTPIGVVPGASLEKLALGARGVRVSSGVVDVESNAFASTRGDDDRTRDETFADDHLDDDRADDHLDADLDLDADVSADVSAAVNVAGARVELSESQRASVAASVACLL